MSLSKRSDTAIVIRAATEADIAFLAEAELAVFTDPWSDRAITAHMAVAHNLSLIALLDGIPVGYLFSAVLPPEGELYRIAVLPAYRKNAVGRALLTAFHAEMSSRGVTRIFLEVRAQNEAAICLYRNAGYAECGIRKRYYRDPVEDALLLSCDLENAIDNIS